MLDVILLLFSLALLTRYIQFRWSRQNLYKEAAKFEGPAGWPLIGNAVEFLKNATKSMEFFIDLGAIYPKIARVWIGPELVFVVNDSKALEVILNSPKALVKKDYFYNPLIPIIGLGLVIAPVPRWKRHRKIINPSFNQQLLNGFMDTVAEQCTILVEQLGAFANKGEFDIIVPISKCTVDATCETIMGVKIDQQRSSSNFQFIIHRMSEIVAERMLTLFYHSDVIYQQTKLAREFNDLKKQFWDFTGKVIREKRQQLENRTEDSFVMDEHTNKRKTFLESLLEKPDFTEEELNEEVNTFMIGASDTVSLAAGFIFIMLGIHGEIQDKVLEEVLNVVGPDRQVEPADLPQMKYTECVIKETLRLFPGFPMIARALEDDIIPFQDELTLPKGSAVLVPILSIHRMDKYWPDPLKFNPERFLPEESAKRHSYSFLPFSAGPRNCIGYKYGLMILKAMVASVVRTYKVSTRFKKVEDVELKFEVTLGSKHGFPVSLKSR